jgi:GNAT superfamily N-acetyltransferase
MTEVHIRKANLEDAAAIATIMRDLGWFERINAESPEATTQKIARHLELCHADNSHLVYVAEVEGMVQGYAAVHFVPYLIFDGPEGYVSELFIAESARGQGIGTKLLDVIAREARARGCSRLGLLNNRVRESYRREFYKKRGWQERDNYVHFILKLDN